MSYVVYMPYNAVMFLRFMLTLSSQEEIKEIRLLNWRYLST